MSFTERCLHLEVRITVLSVITVQLMSIFIAWMCNFWSRLLIYKSEYRKRSVKLAIHVYKDHKYCSEKLYSVKYQPILDTMHNVQGALLCIVLTQWYVFPLHSYSPHAIPQLPSRKLYTNLICKKVILVLSVGK